MDGWVLIEINPNGQMRVKEKDSCLELEFFDFRLKNVGCEWDNDFIIEMVSDQLPKHLKDVLVQVFFTYKSVPCGNGDYWDTEYEDVIAVDTHVIVKTDYKNFYQKMVTEELKLQPFCPEPDSEDTKHYYNDLVWNWEEFYDEDFTPFKPESIKLGSGFRWGMI
jgi:hypothetical protein